MDIERVREVARRLLVSTEALAALGAAIELRTGSATADPKLEAQVGEVLRVLGVDAELGGASTEVMIALLAEIRLTFLQSVKLLHSTTLQPGWTHTEEEFLQSQGQFSAVLAPMLQRAVVPQLDELAVRLEAPTASFLDVGVGVAAISIAMARLWPALRVVGIDPWEPALRLARKNVASAGLGDRIELRRQMVEDLADSAAFDLVWFPAPFIRGEHLVSALQRVRLAMRPGGWIVSGLLNRPNEPLAAAVADLRSVYVGGQPLLPSELEKLMQESGFDAVRVIRGAPGSAAVLVVGRRSPRAS